MVRVFVPPQALPWLRITCALAIGYFGIWVLAPGLASVLPLSSFEATAAAFLLSLLLFVPLVMLTHLGIRLLFFRSEER